MRPTDVNFVGKQNISFTFTDVCIVLYVYLSFIIHFLVPQTLLPILFHECPVPFAYRRITCLKYLVLAYMLMKSDINPFDSQEVSFIHYRIHSIEFEGRQIDTVRPGANNVLLMRRIQCNLVRH